MATNNGNQYAQAYVTVPSTKIQAPDITGQLQFAFFDFTSPSSAPANNDLFNLCKLPKGARIVECVVAFDDLGTAGAIVVGITGGTNALETADDDALITSKSVTAADAVSMSEQMLAGGTNAGFLKKLLDEVIVQLKCPTAWDGVSVAVKGYISYAVA